METRKITYKQFIEILSQSIEIGKKNYPVFLMGAICASAIQALTNSTFVLIVFSCFFSNLWLIGKAFIAQTIVAEKKEAKFNDFFIAFNKITILKKLIPYFLTELCILISMLISVGLMALIIFNLPKNNQSVETLKNLNGFFLRGSIFLIIFFIFLFSFLVLFPLILIFQNQNWYTSLKLSIHATFKNFHILIFFLIPLITLILVPLINPITEPLHNGLNQSLPLSLASEAIAPLLTLIVPFIVPFVTVLEYLTYKNIFIFDQPDNKIE